MFAEELYFLKKPEGAGAICLVGTVVFGIQS